MRIEHPGLLALFCLLLTASPVPAIDSLTLQFGLLQGADWKAEGVTLELALGEQESFQLSAERVEHPSLPFPLVSPILTCARGQVSNARISCEEGLLKIGHKALKRDEIPVRFSWERASEEIKIQASGIALTTGRFSLDGELHGNEWKIHLRGRKVELAKLGKIAPVFDSFFLPYSAQGTVDVDARISGKGASLESIRWRAPLSGLTFADPEGGYLGEGISGTWQGEAAAATNGWKGRQELTVTSGEILTPYFYLSPEEPPINASSDFLLTGRNDRLKLSSFSYSHPEILEFTASAELALGSQMQLLRLESDFTMVDIDALYSGYLLPVYAHPMGREIELAGRIEGRIRVENGDEVEIHSYLQELFIEHLSGPGDGEERSGDFAIRGINGDLHLSSKDPAGKQSRLSWEGGHLFRDLTLGSSEISFTLSPSTLELTKKSRFPILDGSLVAETLQLEKTNDDWNLRFDGYLTPISMEAFSRALGWPVMAGKISGMIPGISYQSGRMSVDGAILLQMFEGSLVLRHLVLEDIFGPLPAMTSDIEIKGIDLETLTRTFSFGKITGKLEGRVNGLRMEDWQPISFDAWFATPEGDKSRHRISQKAVENISNLGGSGISGAMSRGFMRFFDEFSYEKLGISCTLHQGICEMGGIETAEKGYYLVKGGGLPRIDVIGYNRNTDWNQLVSKLRQIASTEGPVIE